MLEVQDLNCQLNDLTLSFSFQVKPYSITAIMGESGAGKSTLLGLLSGLQAAKSGLVSFNSDDFTHMPAHLRPLSILFQEHNLFSHLSVFDNIALGLNPKGKFSTQEKQQVCDAAKQVQLNELLTRFPSELSGGQKQRVALARCIVRKRPLLLLDEPFSALDAPLRKKMLALIKKLALEQKITVLMVTHYLEDAKAIADNILVIEKGRVAQSFVQNNAMLF